MTNLQKLLNAAATLCGFYALVTGIGALSPALLVAAGLVIAGGLRLSPVLAGAWPGAWSIVMRSQFDLLISFVAAGAVLAALHDGMAGAVWAIAIAAWLHGWLAVEKTIADDARSMGHNWVVSLGVPLFFGFWLLFFWEALTIGLGIPTVLLPPPSMIGARLVSSTAILMADFRQTFLKAVLAGYAIGCGSAVLVAILVDRNDFLRRGLLPIGNFISALPIIGVAPIMVMWFGFDWQSKAAVIVIMTFFPMMVNTLSGLSAASVMERDLLNTYAASYWQSLFKLRLPAAMPFIFNALKINSTLALIGAIVAEFFGTPIVGIGFRISTEVGRMNLDMVWAEIAVAALAGSASYGALSLLERRVTFWHPSYRTE